GRLRRAAATHQPPAPHGVFRQRAASAARSACRDGAAERPPRYADAGAARRVGRGGDARLRDRAAALARPARPPRPREPLGAGVRRPRGMRDKVALGRGIVEQLREREGAGGPPRGGGTATGRVPGSRAGGRGPAARPGCAGGRARGVHGAVLGRAGGRGRAARPPRERGRRRGR
ncbi:unnamed protein product, partial [Prorocentrum cordatum]